jgi:hypothetical protein
VWSGPSGVRADKNLTPHFVTLNSLELGTSTRPGLKQNNNG